jgi:L-threonate 2-dehydrogenase
VHDDQWLTASADFILSIVPPAAAIAVAERLRDPLSAAASPPIFTDCNAIAPATMRHIEALLDPFHVIDAGIIGGPPLPDTQDPAARELSQKFGLRTCRCSALEPCQA